MRIRYLHRWDLTPKEAIAAQKELRQRSVGVAKTVLVGDYEEPGRERGSITPLIDKGEQIGAVVRTKTGVQPVFVSVGHAVTLKDAVDLVLNCCRGYRLPEPTRQAHLAANRLKASGEGGARSQGGHSSRI